MSFYQIPFFLARWLIVAPREMCEFRTKFPESSRCGRGCGHFRVRASFSANSHAPGTLARLGGLYLRGCGTAPTHTLDSESKQTRAHGPWCLHPAGVTIAHRAAAQH